ncbi:MAG: Trk system potassium transporter TrkA [Prevotellaceae bacterium]|nr:Trk system potassium transporter TrkA [Prevotellaceae bacterium]MDO4931988.1 Trk system potassium transporter TrkA [Prevotellaceae bacterium]
MKIIIAGAYAIGSYLATLLTRTNEEITIIDDDEEAINALNSDLDVLTMHASPISIKALKDIGTAETDLFIAVTKDQKVNMCSCALAKSLGAKQTVAKVEDYEYANEKNRDVLQKMGIDSVIYPEMLAAHDIINGLKMSWVRQRWDVHGGALVMLGIKLRETCEILNQPLKDLCGPDDPYHIVAIKRDNDTIIPNGNDMLQLYDIAYFMTTQKYIPYVRRIVGKEKYADVSNVMIMGGGKTAVRTAHSMPEYIRYKIFEIDPLRCEALNDLLPDTAEYVINGDARDTALLQEEGIRSAQAFVALTGSSETNILACLTAKRNGVRKTVAVIENIDYVDMAESLDIGTIINKKTIVASHIYEMILKGKASNVRYLMQAKADVAEFTAQPNSKITKKRIFELGLPKGITFGGLVRGSEGMLISGGTQIQAGDIVMVFCHNADMKRIEKLFL